MSEATYHGDGVGGFSVFTWVFGLALVTGGVFSANAVATWAGVALMLGSLAIEATMVVARIAKSGALRKP